ncbi:MAG: ABC transporter ATP-binding protein, partial [Armatimonadia bacterium]
ASLKHQITTVEFNNALLKRVRQCRPLIADKLWTIVLSAVSSYFSEMRGVRSVVTKDSDGFKVDGYPVAGLSGSTLDILGLAIRVALTRTFLPNAPFMVLDEPCAAMDTARTESTLGFIVACGFKQILWTTHEDTSQTVADHLIVLGETA